MAGIERALFILNRAAGVGHQAALVEPLGGRLRAGLPADASLQIEPVDNHAQARHTAASFLNASSAPAFVVAGGGGGTLRAVIEGLCEGSSAGLPGPERVRVTALRMGSGNVLAKQFGVPKDPLAGLDGVLRNLSAGVTAPCCIMRCEARQPDGRTAIFHAATLGGFGQFGRVPGDLARWHRRFPRFHGFSAKVLGIERLTNVKYGVSLLLRSWHCALWPRAMEEIELRAGDAPPRKMRLLAGALLNFPLRALPFRPDLRVQDAALSLHLMPFSRRRDALALVLAPNIVARQAVTVRLEAGATAQLRLPAGAVAEFFLDEDPHVFQEHLTLSVAGTLAFVPGPEYRAPVIETGIQT